MEMPLTNQDKLKTKRYKTKVKQILKTVFKSEDLAEQMPFSEYYLNMTFGIMPSVLACAIFYNDDDGDLL